MTLTEQIKAEAGRLGFQLVGVATPEPPPHLDVFEHWLAAGRHAEMGYLATSRARQCRADPRLLLPECRSILVVGMLHFPSAADQPSPAQPPKKQGRIASYAWGDDYHDVLPKRLRRLVAFIEAQVGRPIPHRCYSDTGPILERELAQRAGLGWIGKNTCLIHPKLGSFFLLAEILLGLELEPDAPFDADRCGSCTRCCEACPTGCILPDRTINAARCISYLTIEHKGEIQTDLRPLLGEWVFGCDVCQMVCPWNQRFTSHRGEAAFAPRPDVMDERGYLHQTSLELRLSPTAFSQQYKDSPIKRAKRRGYLRNVAVALGNTGDESALPDLTWAAHHDAEPLVRAHATWALEQISGAPALIEHINRNLR